MIQQVFTFEDEVFLATIDINSRAVLNNATSNDRQSEHRLQNNLDKLLQFYKILLATQPETSGCQQLGHSRKAIKGTKN